MDPEPWIDVTVCLAALGAHGCIPAGARMQVSAVAGPPLCEQL